MNLKFVPNTLGVVLMAGFFILLSALLYALPLWIIWNWTIPRLFNGPPLEILDAFLLNLLTGLLFRGKDK
ncbi:MAG: hypothetical protein AABW92_03910 [Nanoarchaeota archaeon]